MKNNWKKDTTLFLTSQIISLFGSSLVQYAIMWYITLETKSGIMMTISIICGSLPAFFLSPFAGVWADRYNRKLLIILSDSLIAVATLILAILYLIGYKYIWLLFVISAIRAAGSGIQSPAISAFLPQFVPKEKLTKVNGINTSVNSIVSLLSPMLSATLLTVSRIETIFFIDVITAAFAVLTLALFLKVPPHAKSLERKANGYFSDMKDGITYIKGHKYIKYFFVFCIFFFFLIAPVTFLTPLQVTRNYGSDVWRLTAIEIAFSIGMMIGGLIISQLGGFKNRIHTMSLACLITGLTTFVLGFGIYFWFYLIIMWIMGIVVPMFHTPATVLLQEKVEENYLGRVFGILGMIPSFMVPLGMIVFGPLADIFHIEILLLFTGALLIITSFFLGKNKVLLEHGK